MRHTIYSLICGTLSTALYTAHHLQHNIQHTIYSIISVSYTHLAQGFSLMQDASRLYGWNLDLGKIASIFRAGCIIQAVFLNDITHAFEAEPKPESLIFDGFFLSRINEHQDSLRQAVSTGVMNGLPIPALCNAVSYLDEFRAKAAGANLILSLIHI